MTVTLDLSEESYTWLHEEARRCGMTLEALIAQDVEQRQLTARRGSPLPERDTQRLQAVNRGVPEAFWQPYRRLIVRRREEVLDREELQELVHLSERAEAPTLRCVEALTELARLRGVPLECLYRDLGIQPVDL
jgi:hypothetical protein